MFKLKKNSDVKANGEGSHKINEPVLSEGLSASKGGKALELMRMRAGYRRVKNGIGEAEWKKKADERYAEAVKAFNKARNEIKPGERRYFYELVEMLSESTKLRWNGFVKSIGVLPKHLESGFLHSIGMVEEAAVSGKAIPEPEHTKFTNPHELFGQKK
ncbi:Uncharacterised protein [uncultured archaeon]|nr:Uncharacterised protein [uncultured archaeon]